MYPYGLIHEGGSGKKVQHRVGLGRKGSFVNPANDLVTGTDSGPWQPLRQVRQWTPYLAKISGVGWDMEGRSSL